MKSVINPESFVKPVGYANALKCSGGTTVYLAGQVAFDSEGKIVHAEDIVGQFRQTLANLDTTIRTAGGAMTDIVKMTIFVTDKHLYKKHLKEIGGIYREFFGKYFPAMTLVEVSALFEDDALLEIEGIAVID